MNTPEMRSLLYGWITVLLTSVIGGVGWWIKHVTDTREADQKAAAAAEPQRDEIFTRQMQMLLDDCRHEMAIRDARIEKRDAEIVALRVENDRLRQGGTQRRQSDTHEGPG